MNSAQPLFEESPRLAKLRIPLAKGARDSLEASIARHGVLVPLVVGTLDGKNVLLDGHTRAGVCEKLAITPPITSRQVETEEQLELLFVQIQLARRNLPEIGEAFLRGSVYLERRRQGSRTTSRHSGEKSAAEVLAVDFGTSPRTIERDGSLARAMKEIEIVLGEQVRNELCSGEIKATRREIELISKMTDEEMDENVKRLRRGEALDAEPREPHKRARAMTRVGEAPARDPENVTPPSQASVFNPSPTGDRPDAVEDQAVRGFDGLHELAMAREGLASQKSKLRRLLRQWSRESDCNEVGILEALERATALISEAHDIVEREVIVLDRREEGRSPAPADAETPSGPVAGTRGPRVHGRTNRRVRPFAPA